MLGGMPEPELDLPDDGKSFFYRMHYNKIRGSFEDPPANLPCLRDDRKHRFCEACERMFQKEMLVMPKVGEEMKTEDSKEVCFCQNIP